MDKQIDELVSSREKFNAFVYTPLDEALEELKKRKADRALKTTIKSLVTANLPKTIEERPHAILFRQVATPNYEFRRFVSLVDPIEDLTPLVLEYYKDKFTDNNEFKYHLAMLAFFFGRGKKGGEKIRLLNTIDFNSSRGKKISEIKMSWGQSLIDFHHELLDHAYENNEKPCEYFDASKWFSENGANALHYYKNFLALFIQNGILFENFMLDEKEIRFTKEIFLPAFIKIHKETGQKPLIVSLEPTDIESDKFWMCHPAETLPFVEKKLASRELAV